MSAAALARGRAAAEALMVDACVVRRPTGETTDPTTGAVTSTFDTLYTGKCKIQQSSRPGGASGVDVGEAHLLLQRVEVHLPMSAGGFQPDDEVTVTAAAYDPDLVGQMFVVRDVPSKSMATARRLGVVRRTS